MEVFLSKVRVLISGCICLSVFCTFSCLAPFNEQVLLRVKDTISPEILIIYPDNDSYYASTVMVTGTVTDYSSHEGQSGEILSLSYEIIPATIEGDSIDFDTDGVFSFCIRCAENPKPA